jgi:hypothetical protein
MSAVQEVWNSIVRRQHEAYLEHHAKPIKAKAPGRGHDRVKKLATFLVANARAADVDDALLVAGGALFTVGVWWLYPPAALMFGGGFLAALGVGGMRRAR